MPAEEPPVPTGATKSTIHAYAEQVAEFVGFRPGDAFEPIVSRLSGRMTYQTPEMTFGGLPPSIIIQPDGSFVIHLPTTTSPQRNRFTVAHELGHLFLHFPMVQKRKPGASMMATRWVDENNPALQRAEWEANWFAAAFLMPSAKFQERAAALGGNGDALAQEFDVSLQAVQIRAKTLSIQLQ